MRKSKTSNRINELKFLIDWDTDSVKALFTSDLNEMTKCWKSVIYYIVMKVYKTMESTVYIYFEQEGKQRMVLILVL